MLERRNRVLQRLADLGWVSRGRVRRAQAERLHSAPVAAGPRPYAPYFAEIAAQEARLRFGLGDLADGGYQLFSTLDLRQQLAAEAAVTSGLAAIEGARHRGHHDPPLEATLISLDPRDGAILAYVGGRDYRRSQFDRISQAHRQLGSTFKPVVYAAAFEAGFATPATLLDDSPIEVRSGNTVWNPQNYDRRQQRQAELRPRSLSCNRLRPTRSDREEGPGCRETCQEAGRAWRWGRRRRSHRRRSRARS